MEEVTKELLIRNGFEEIVVGSLKHLFRIWTNDKPAWKLDVELHAEFNNTMKEHYVHIDNNVCNTAGALEFDTIKQFNFLMQALGSKFRLKA